MQRFLRFITVFALLCTYALCAHAQQDTRSTRALLVACSDFETQEDLGAAISGNLHMVGSALISADIGLGNLSIEDGTIGTVDALSAALTDAFSEADEDDLSILYLCTHGVLSSSDDGQVYLLLGDGKTESMLSSNQLYDLICNIQDPFLMRDDDDGTVFYVSPHLLKYLDQILETPQIYACFRFIEDRKL